MDALNQKERTVTFWKFFGTFLLLVVVVVLATVLAVSVDDTQMAILQDENDALRSQTAQIQSSLALMKDIQTSMETFKSDTFANNPAQSKFLEKKLTDEIYKMQGSISNDSSDLNIMQHMVASAYAAWYGDSKIIKSSAGGSQRTIELQRQLDECKKENLEVLQKLTFYKNLAPSQN